MNPPFIPEDRVGNRSDNKGYDTVTRERMRRRKTRERRTRTDKEKRKTRSYLRSSTLQQPEEEEEEPGTSAGQVLLQE